MFKLGRVPADEEWTMDFCEFSQHQVKMLEYSLKRLKQRKQRRRGPLSPPPPLEGEKCDLCQREAGFLTSFPYMEILDHYENLRDNRTFEDYPCCKRRTVRLIRRRRIVADYCPELLCPFGHENFLQLEHMEEEIVSNNNSPNPRALDDHNSYCQNTAGASAGDTVTQDIVLDHFHPLSAVNPDCIINPNIMLGSAWGGSDNTSSGCVSPSDLLSSFPTTSVLSIPDSITVSERGDGSDSGYTTPEMSPAHGDSVPVEITNTHVALPSSSNKEDISNHPSVGSALPAVHLDNARCNPLALAGRSCTKKNRSQIREDPTLAKKKTKKGKGKRRTTPPPVTATAEEERKRQERNKQKAMKEKQRRDKSKVLLDQVRAFLGRSFPTMLGHKSAPSHQRVIDCLLQLVPAVGFQENSSKRYLFQLRDYLRKKGY